MKIAFTTLGCKVNQYDTAAMETALLRGGDRIVPFEEVADVYVVNSCTVTDRADAESRKLARRARRLNPEARVIMTGCFAQVSPETAAIAEVDYVVGVGRIPEVLKAVRGEIEPSAARILVGNLRKEKPEITLGAEVFAGQTRAFLKVQEGCDLFCSFCIVPLARGGSRSVPPNEVLGQLHRLAEKGFKEVVLSGVHLGGYGADLEPRRELEELLEMIAEAKPVPRIRLSSIDPPEVSPRLLDIISRSDVFCPHLHLPIQAGSDRVLQRMRRRYDTALVRDVIAEIRRLLPDAGLGTDVIAGFPGETESDFCTGLEFLQEQSLTYFHVFPYSRRRGTTAARSPDQVAASETAMRARALRRLGERKRRLFIEEWLGREMEVLFESSRDRETGYLAGYSRNYLRVLADGPDEWVNRELRVKAVGRLGVRTLGMLLPDSG